MFLLLLSSAHTEQKHLLLLTQPSVRRIEVHKELEGDTAGTASPRETPHHMVSYSAYKPGGRRKDIMFRVLVFAFPRSPLHIEPCCPGDG